MSVTRINAALDCDGAQVHAQCRHLATVVTVSGHIGADNVNRLEVVVTPYILAEKPFILDLSGVESCSRHVTSLLATVDADCHLVGVEWCLVPGDAVPAALFGSRDSDDYPMAHSAREALGYFAEEASARRRLIPVFTKTA